MTPRTGKTRGRRRRGGRRSEASERSVRATNAARAKFWRPHSRADGDPLPAVEAGEGGDAPGEGDREEVEEGAPARPARARAGSMLLLLAPDDGHEEHGDHREADDADAGFDGSSGRRAPAAHCALGVEREARERVTSPASPPGRGAAAARARRAPGRARPRSPGRRSARSLAWSSRPPAGRSCVK